MRSLAVSTVVAVAALASACKDDAPRSSPSPSSPPPATSVVAPRAATPPRVTRDQARAMFGTLPRSFDSPTNPITPEKVELGRMLYHDARLSKNQDVSCNSCHGLASFGVDGLPVSKGHRDQTGTRSSPTVYNAAGHATQFWDGRAADVEEQAKGPVLNPVEMAMPDAAAVERVLRSIPGYRDRFAAAFPGDADPITYDNMARAIGAFERQLVTPAPFDRWLDGDDGALSDQAHDGLALFVSSGCTACHLGPQLGGRASRRWARSSRTPTSTTWDGWT